MGIRVLGNKKIVKTKIQETGNSDHQKNEQKTSSYIRLEKFAELRDK